MRSLGPTLTRSNKLATEALAGSEGVTLGVVDRQRAKRIVETNPIRILDKLGPRLSSVETDHYRVRFQLADSRLAALILELSGETPTVEGLSHEELSEMLGIYRETVTVSLTVMELDNLIKVDRMKITILDKRGLKELSEL